jgi:hypothetical protein
MNVRDLLHDLWRCYASPPTLSLANRHAWIYVDASSREEARRKTREIAATMWGPMLPSGDPDEGFCCLDSFDDLNRDNRSAFAVLRVLEVGTQGQHYQFVENPVFATNLTSVLQDALASTWAATSNAGAFTTFERIDIAAFEELKGRNDTPLVRCRQTYSSDFESVGLRVQGTYDQIARVFGQPYKKWCGHKGMFWPIQFSDGARAVVCSLHGTRLAKAERGIAEPWAIIYASGQSNWPDKRGAWRALMLLAEPRLSEQRPHTR